MPTGRGRSTAALLAAGLLVAAGLAGCSTPRGEAPVEASPSASATSTEGAAHRSPDRPSSPFGMVKGGVGDTVIAPAWVKTIWTPQAVDGTSVNADSWRSSLERTRQYGQIEVPVVADEVWKTGSIDDIKNVMRQLFLAYPEIPVWEMGLEENLRSGWEASLPRTAQKLAAVREVKDSINPRIKLAYQIADDTGKTLETFLKSDASDYVDIISIHPYAWPDFKTPDVWLDPLLAKVRRLEATYSKNLPVWFTEVGAPTNDAGVQLYSGSSLVSGISPQEQADYLTKVYATALNHGVEKIFWYEYEDSCSTPSDVECHFGLKYQDGKPKPGYFAYQATSDCVGSKNPAGERTRGITRISSFVGKSGECDVVWNYPDSKTAFPLSALAATSRDVQAFDVTGHPLATTHDEVPISGSPVFLHISR